MYIYMYIFIILRKIIRNKFCFQDLQFLVVLMSATYLCKYPALLKMDFAKTVCFPDHRCPNIRKIAGSALKTKRLAIKALKVWRTMANQHVLGRSRCNWYRPILQANEPIRGQAHPNACPDCPFQLPHLPLHTVNYLNVLSTRVCAINLSLTHQTASSCPSEFTVKLVF